MIATARATNGFPLASGGVGTGPSFVDSIFEYL